MTEKVKYKVEVSFADGKTMRDVIIKHLKEAATILFEPYEKLKTKMQISKDVVETTIMINEADGIMSDMKKTYDKYVSAKHKHITTKIPCILTVITKQGNTIYDKANIVALMPNDSVFLIAYNGNGNDQNSVIVNLKNLCIGEPCEIKGGGNGKNNEEHEEHEESRDDGDFGICE